MSQLYQLSVWRPVVQCLDAGKSYTAKMLDLAQELIELELEAEERARASIRYHLLQRPEYVWMPSLLIASICISAVW